MSSSPPELNRLYASVRWARVRRHQLRQHALCAMCAARGLTVAAEVVDHVEPHRGNVLAFWTAPLQSLCKPCHDSPKRWVENRGYDPYPVGADGWPLDPRHPANAKPGSTGAKPGSTVEKSFLSSQPPKFRRKTVQRAVGTG